MLHPYSIFLPVRAGSQRVPHKNVRPFAGIPGGLVELKLRQLARLPSSVEIILSTDDPQALEIGRSMEFATRVRIDGRPAHLCTSHVPLAELIRHVPKVCEHDRIIWTHVTSPFFDEFRMIAAVKEFEMRESQGFDSLMSVTRGQKYLWDPVQVEPVNYKRAVNPWPSTQTLPLWVEVNSAVFIADRESYEVRSDRIGLKPFCWECDMLSSIDVDWEEDFRVAEALYRSLPHENENT